MQGCRTEAEVDRIFETQVLDNREQDVVWQICESGRHLDGEMSWQP